MGIVVILVFSGLVASSTVGFALSELTLEADRPSMSVPVLGNALLQCCWKSKSVTYTWVKQTSNYTLSFLNGTGSVTSSNGVFCGQLKFTQVQLDQTAFYSCMLNNGSDVTHGTYLRVYEPLKKTINLSETTKNKILIAEGFLLLLCVLLPSSILLFKSKELNDLEKKNAKKEEENIYQGLNLDDCCATYDQIERSQTQGPYQDVGNIKEEEEEIQLEKP
ncbi:B-cell antigen receptor complex-associated protein alpha chain [Archocentrus centrarchus]|uniref:B-cell antigen receptor complex-associated protein alpha chain n=1 Tax=Archocentrus centrarchus TaxID=63155 RepID=UPI0011EA0F42|nr:B-cell antigen receptor complex-associated protein alpha chain [Archocentrus centrarchus]